MPDAPRRRRLGEDPPRGGGLPLVPLIIVVVLGGLLLGAVLAHYFGSKNSTIVQVTPQPVISVTPLPTQNPLPTQRPLEATSPSSLPSTTPTPKSTATSGTTPAPAVTASPQTTASPKASTSSPKPVILPKAVTPKPAASPKPQAIKTPVHTAAAPVVVHSAPPPTATDQAENVVRYYLDALARGDTGEARSYLSGSDPTESSFMTHSAHLTSLRSAAAGGNTYNVNADVSTSQGEYFITFTVDVESNGAIITDHTAIKP